MTHSYVHEDAICYVNGEYVRHADAQISIFDHVVLYGDGVYDTMIARNHRLFKMDAHLARLYRSADVVGLTMPVDIDTLRDIILKICTQGQIPDAYVKIVATRGVGPRPLLNPYNCHPGLIVFAVPVLSLSGPGSGGWMEDVPQGIRMNIAQIRRTPDECLRSTIKSCNYLGHVLAFMEAKEAGVDSVIELDPQGFVCEAPGYNLFAVKDGGLLTPKDNILLGITRGTVIDLARESGISVVEGRLRPADVYEADEVFLTNSADGVLPVKSVDGRSIASEQPGPVTLQMRRKYFGLLASGRYSTDYARVPQEA